MKNLSKTTKALLLAVAALAVAALSDWMGYTTIAVQAVHKGDEFMAAYHEAKAEQAASVSLTVQ